MISSWQMKLQLHHIPIATLGNSCQSVHKRDCEEQQETNLIPMWDIKPFTCCSINHSASELFIKKTLTPIILAVNLELTAIECSVQEINIWDGFGCRKLRRTHSIGYCCCWESNPHQSKKGIVNQLGLKYRRELKSCTRSNHRDQGVKNQRHWVVHLRTEDPVPPSTDKG